MSYHSRLAAITCASQKAVAVPLYKASCEIPHTRIGYSPYPWGVYWERVTSRSYTPRGHTQKPLVPYPSTPGGYVRNGRVPHYSHSPLTLRKTPSGGISVHLTVKVQYAKCVFYTAAKARRTGPSRISRGIGLTSLLWFERMDAVHSVLCALIPALCQVDHCGLCEGSFWH